LIDTLFTRGRVQLYKWVTSEESSSLSGGLPPERPKQLSLHSIGEPTYLLRRGTDFGCPAIPKHGAKASPRMYVGQVRARS